VIWSRWPRALKRSTQNPFSSLWKGDALDEAGKDLGRTHCRGARHLGIMEIKKWERYRDQGGTAGQVLVKGKRRQEAAGAASQRRYAGRTNASSSLDTEAGKDAD